MTEVFFAEQKDGYDKSQVDSYINKLAEAYQTAYQEYLAICEKYNSLMRDYKKLESEKQTVVSADIVMKTLINSEKLASEIIENARAEETKIVETTVKNLQYAYKTLEHAMSEVQKCLTFNSFATGQDSDDKESGGIFDEIEIVA